MPRNILEVIHSISEDKTLQLSHNLTQIGRIDKGFAPMLTEILEDYISQNTGGPIHRMKRIKAANPYSLHPVPDGPAPGQNLIRLQHRISSIFQPIWVRVCAD